MGRILEKSACPTDMIIRPMKETRKKGMAMSALRPNALIFLVQMKALRIKKGAKADKEGAASKKAV